MTVRRPAGGPRFLKSARDGLMFFSRRGTLEPGRTADVAQLVERNLAKVEVAGSNPVVRSERVRRAYFSVPAFSMPAYSVVEWPRGEATACKAVYTGSNPVSTSTPSRESVLCGLVWTIGAAVARFPDTEEVTGSIPVSSTKAIGDSCPRKARTGSPSSFCAAALRLPPAGASPPAPPCAFASLGGLGRVGRPGHRHGLGSAVSSPVWAGSSRSLGGLGWVGQAAHRFGLGSAVSSPGCLGHAGGKHCVG